MKVDKFDYNRKKLEILEVIDELDIPTSSFTSYFSSSLDEVKDDIKLVVDELHDNGIDLFQFIKDYEKEVFRDGDFCSKDGFMDSILYLYDKENGILSGQKLIDGDDSDYFYKYMYGYYTYDMGKNYILQSFNNLDEYYEATANKLLYAFISEHFGGTEENINMCSIIENYVDGHIIYAHLESLLSMLNFQNVSNGYEKFVKEVSNDIKIPHKIINGVLIIYIGKKYVEKEKTIVEVTKRCELLLRAKKYNL